MSIIMALSLVVVLMVLGMAVDYGRYFHASTKLQSVADATSLAAAANPNYSNVQVQKVAWAYFNNANVASFVDRPKMRAVRKKLANGANNITVTASGRYTTSFMGIWGVKSMTVNATSVASIQSREFTAYVAVDMSDSMGLAADPAARDALKQLTAPYFQFANDKGCEFACHQRDGWEPTGKTVYQMARQAGIALREDVLISAFGQFVDGYLANAKTISNSQTVKIGVIGFSDEAKLLHKPSSNANAIKNSLNSFPANEHWATVYRRALPQIQDIMGKQGDGSPGNPVKTLILVTDGMPWVRGSDQDNGKPLDSSYCDPIKKAGFQLVVVDVKYRDSSPEYFFNTYIKSFYSSVSPALKACASPGMYFVANDSDITTLNTTFAQVLKSLKGKVALTR